MTSLGPSRTSSHGASVVERVGEVEEVAAAGVEVAVRQPVHERRDGDEAEPDQRLPIESPGHVAGDAVVVGGAAGAPAVDSAGRRPTHTTATRVSAKTSG